MKRALAAFLFLAPAALAEGDLVATITAAGATASTAVKYGQTYELQCNGDARMRTGDSTVTVTNTDGAVTKGRKVLQDVLFPFATDKGQNYVAVIPADGSSTIKCDVFLRTKTSL